VQHAAHQQSRRLPRTSRHRRVEEGSSKIAAIAEAQLKQKTARYRSATGEAWSGDGEMPQWLKQAISAAQSMEHFAVEGTSPAASATIETRTKVDWSQDPFAGSRLAAAQPSHRDT